MAKVGWLLWEPGKSPLVSDKEVLGFLLSNGVSLSWPVLISSGEGGGADISSFSPKCASFPLKSELLSEFREDITSFVRVFEHVFLD